MAQQKITVGNSGADSRRVLEALTPVNATGAPAVNATYLGQMYIDETPGTEAVYIAIKVGSETPADDWQKIAAAV